MFQKIDIKIQWGRLEGIAPQLFGRGSNRLHRPHGVGAYCLRHSVLPLTHISLLVEYLCQAAAMLALAFFRLGSISLG